ncbi:MAG: type IV secretion system protein [Candidatus Accumulibacter sp.]|jgi:type IV secretion system protein VirB6|nr:type IV secretion system protein [Accumulibacter sp.]
MNDKAPITWLLNRINAIVTAGAGATARGIADTIMPLVFMCFGIYILLILVNYMRGSEDAPVMDFMMRIAAFAAVGTFGLNADIYVAEIMPILTGLGGDLANAVSGGTVGAGTLNQLSLHYLKIIDEGFTAAGNLSGMDKILPL